MSTPIKSIRAYCVQHCMYGQVSEVRRCTCSECQLFPYRLGRDPARAGKGGNPPAAKKSGVEGNFSLPSRGGIPAPGEHGNAETTVSERGFSAQNEEREGVAK